jgi:hypothetical protein
MSWGLAISPGISSFFLLFNISFLSCILKNCYPRPHILPYCPGAYRYIVNPFRFIEVHTSIDYPTDVHSFFFLIMFSFFVKFIDLQCAYV